MFAISPILATFSDSLYLFFIHMLVLTLSGYPFQLLCKAIDHNLFDSVACSCKYTLYTQPSSCTSALSRIRHSSSFAFPCFPSLSSLSLILFCFQKQYIDRENTSLLFTSTNHHLLQIMSGTTANDPIEPDYEPIFLGRYSGFWQELTTGSQLVEWEKFPEIAPPDPVRRGGPRVKAVPRLKIVPTPKDKNRVITCGKLSRMTLIPSRQMAEKIQSMADKLGTQKSCLEVPDFGIFSYRAVYFLHKIYQARDFPKDLLEMGSWLSITVRQFDQPFVDWFYNVLFEEPGIMSKKFIVSSEVDLSIQGM